MTQHPNTAAEAVATFAPPTDRPLRIVVLASGQGSLFQSLLDTWVAGSPIDGTAQRTDVTTEESANPTLATATASATPAPVDNGDIAQVQTVDNASTGQVPSIENPSPGQAAAIRTNGGEPRRENALHNPHPRVEIAALVCDKACPALERAQSAHVEAAVVEFPPLRGLAPEEKQATRTRWDADLTRVVAAYSPDIVVSAGFMRILGAEFLAEFGGRTINTHPALLPAFPGAHAVPDAVAYGAKVTGSTIHLVDAGVDTGPILAQEAVPIHPGETADVVHERIKIVERRLLVSVIDAIAERGFTSDGRKATLLS